MGAMNKMRQNTGVLLWVLVIAFGGLWVIQDTGALDTVGQQSVGDTIARVNGEKVEYQEYTRTLEQYLQQYQARTGESAPPQVEDMYREQAFNALVSNKLREQAMDRLGIEVSNAEVLEMVLGETPDPFIRQQFGDEQGNINRARLQSVIDNPQARQDWIRIEEYLRSKRRQQKLNQLLGSAVRVTEQDVVNEYIRRNKSVDAQYLALPYAAVPNSAVEVSTADLRSYYESHKEEFKQPRTYTMEYITYSKEPTAKDTARIVNELEELKDEFAAAENDSVFVSRHFSATPYTSAYMSRDELDAEFAQALYSDLSAGRIVGPLVSGDQAHLAKIVDVRTADEPTIHAQHILLRAPSGDEEALEEARQQAQELKQQIQQGKEFAALARQHSQDPGSASQGGDLGWIAPGTMVEPFSDAAFDASVGQVVGPVKTRFGYHLIKVLDRSNQEVQIADLTRQIQTDVSTLSDIEGQALDLQYYATESGDFASEAQNQNKEVQQVQVQEDMDRIPGIGSSARVMAFLERAQQGSISDVIELNDQFLVAYVSDIQEAGYRSFEEVRAEIEPRVRLEKKKEYQQERLLEAYNNNSFEELAGALDAELQTASNINMTNPVISGLGREPRFVGAAFGLNQGEVSPVITGENAAFVIKATSVNEPNVEQLTPAQRQSIRQNLQQQRLQQVRNEWVAGLREEAEIEDNRNVFLRRQ